MCEGKFRGSLRNICANYSVRNFLSLYIGRIKDEIKLFIEFKTL